MKFKLKLVKQPREELQWNDKRKMGVGLYEQLRKGSSNIPYDSKVFTMEEMKQALSATLNNAPKERKVNIITNEQGMKLFQEAMKNRLDKKDKNEYRQRFNLKSEIFKQTYKFRQQHLGQSDL